MFAYERQNKIAERVKQNGSITVQEIIKDFNVSIETVRKDLSFLENANRLKRVHGGAVAIFPMENAKSLDERIDEHKGRKQELSKNAITLICEGDVIAIDSGSTAIEFISVLKQTFKKNITLITHSLDVFEMIKENENYQSILIGGDFLKKEAAFYGHLALETINSLHFSKTFIFPTAVSIENGISDYEANLALIEKNYIKRADQTIVLADSSKFEKNAFIKLCDIHAATCIVTDNKLNDTIYELYKQNGINVLK